MRIVGGTLRGRRLVVPKGGTRPTTDRAREAIFNLVTARIGLDGARVLDLFAGSGALGLEALSRGAAHATFVDLARESLAAVRANVHALDLGARSSVRRGDAFRFLERGGRGEGYGVVFADPPYDLPGTDRLVELVLPLLEPGGLFVLEHPGLDLEEQPQHELTRKYGGTSVSMFRAPVG